MAAGAAGGRAGGGIASRAHEGGVCVCGEGEKGLRGPPVPPPLATLDEFGGGSGGARGRHDVWGTRRILSSGLPLLPSTCCATSPRTPPIPPRHHPHPGGAYDGRLCLAGSGVGTVQAFAPAVPAQRGWLGARPRTSVDGERFKCWQQAPVRLLGGRAWRADAPPAVFRGAGWSAGHTVANSSGG